MTTLADKIRAMADDLDGGEECAAGEGCMNVACRTARDLRALLTSEPAPASPEAPAPDLDLDVLADRVYSQPTVGAAREAFRAAFSRALSEARALPASDAERWERGQSHFCLGCGELPPHQGSSAICPACAPPNGTCDCAGCALVAAAERERDEVREAGRREGIEEARPHIDALIATSYHAPQCAAWKAKMPGSCDCGRDDALFAASAWIVDYALASTTREDAR